MDGWKRILSFWDDLFSGVQTVSFREGIDYYIYIYSKISSIPLKGHEETSIQNPSAAPWRAPQDSGDDARCPEGLRGASLWGEVG